MVEGRGERGWSLLLLLLFLVEGGVEVKFGRRVEGGGRGGELSLELKLEEESCLEELSSLEC